MPSKTPWWKRKGKLGSTLIDVLVASSIIVVLGGMVLYAVRPRSSILIGWDSRRTSQAETIANASQHYQFDVQNFPHQDEILEGEGNAVPICRQGVAHGSDGCISFDDLVPSYIESIPLDPVETCESYSGFAAYTQVNGRYIGIQAVHRGKLPGAATDGCLPAGGGSSSSSSNSSSSSSGPQATLTVITTVVNDDGGSLVAGSVTTYVHDDLDANVSGSPAAGSAVGVVFVLSPGSYTVSADAVTDYTMNVTGDCTQSLGGLVTLADGDAKTCTLTFDDDALPSWETFDPGANGVGIDPDGFAEMAFDGRYVYFSPDDNGTAPHGEVLRYDTQGSFTNTASWATFDAGANGVGTDPDGFEGPTYDGSRYVYFSQFHNGTAPNAEILRYDTQGTFNTAGSWAAYNPTNNGLTTAARGFSNSVFDGRYLYFVPMATSTAYHGRVMRYDTQGSFTTIGSWTSYDPGSSGLGGDPDGYMEAAFDGRYLYFSPYFNGTTFHGAVLRYDTQASFTTLTSWSQYDPGANGVGTDPDGFAGAIFDGRYVYFVPLFNGSAYTGEVMRYDTQGSFTSTSSWTTFDPSSNGLGVTARGYVWGTYDGSRYVYFSPYENSGGKSGAAMRYDTQGAFNSIASWELFDPGANGVGTDPDGYAGALFDGRYVYFSPDHNGTARHGEVMRYDTTRPFAQP